MTESKGILSSPAQIELYRRIVNLCLRKKSAKEIARVVGRSPKFIHKVKCLYTINRVTIVLSPEGRTLMDSNQETFFFMKKRRSPRKKRDTGQEHLETRAQRLVRGKILRSLGRHGGV